MLRFFLTALFLLWSIIPGFTQAQFNAQIPQLGDNPQVYSTAETNNNTALTRLLYNYRQGAYITYDNASNIYVGAGEVSCNSNTGGTQGENVLFRQNTASTTANVANLDIGNSFSASTTYYIYASCDAAATTFTVVISLNSATPTGVTNYRQLGNFTTDSASNISQIVDNSIQTYFGTWDSTKSMASVYHATTDGFVMAWTTGCGNGQGLTMYTDSSTSPSTVRLSTATTSGITITTYGTMPVRKGDYWEVTTNCSQNSSSTVYWLPLSR